jgi:hypothetical protein
MLRCLELERIAAERLLTALKSGDDTMCLPLCSVPGGSWPAVILL